MSGTPINEIRGGNMDAPSKNSDLVNNIMDTIDGRPNPASPIQQQRPREVEEFTEYDDLDNLPLTERIMLEGKLPLVVAILIILMNQKFVGEMIVKYVGKFVGSNIDIVVLLLKGLFGAIIFYLVRRYVFTYA